MRFLVFTTLYPNAAMPAHGVFVENRLRAFRAKYDCDVKVVAPVPWFPSKNGTFGRYARWARAPLRERRDGVDVLHPRYFLAPKIGMDAAPRALARRLRKTVGDLEREGWDFDFIDAHYFYPDGVAAVDVAMELGKPVAVTARGSDVSLIPDYPGPRRKILNAANGADAVIAVAAALKDELVRLGAPEKKIAVLRNGVDPARFKPMDRARIRAELNLSGPVLLSAGHLIARKGHDIVIDALQEIPGAMLLIAGEGQMRAALEARVKAAGVGARVRFLGAVAPEEMPDLYSAADILALASAREGWPNILLEAMACGAPCVATDAGGSREVIRASEAGKLVESRTSGAVAAAVNALLADPPDRNATRNYARAHSWDETVDAMAEIFGALTEKTKARRSLTTTPIASPRGAAPKLIVTVDTEEAFDWRAFEIVAHRVCDTHGVDRFQQLCAAAGVKPLYFLTYPLLADANVAAYFRRLREDGAADCGLHLHQWATPPKSEFSGEYFSFQKNLPPALQREKLAALADKFEAVFGTRALCHRAGRYGIAPENYALLATVGVKYDFSPSSAFDFSSAGGPDFSAYSNRPFVAAGSGWRIGVTPVSGACALRRTRLFVGQETAPPGFAPSRHSPRDRFLQPMRLSPEGADLADLKALTNRLIADETPALTFTLHSTSLTPGANDYAKSPADVECMLEISRSYFEWFRNEAGGTMISLNELAALYEASA